MKTILVVDDEENILRLYHDELSESGYRVLTAGTAGEALSLVRKDPPDLVVLDIRLENEPAGIDILRRVKEMDKSIPVIINTALQRVQAEFRYLGLGGLCRQILRSRRTEGQDCRPPGEEVTTGRRWGAGKPRFFLKLSPLSRIICKSDY